MSQSEERVTVLGIKKLANIPEIVTMEGVYLYTVDPAFVYRIKKVVVSVLGLQVDKGPINVLLEDQIKIPLVKGQ